MALGDRVVVRNSIAKASIDGVHYAITYREVEEFAFGEQIVVEYLNYGAESQRTHTISYYTDISDNGYGKIKSEIDFDGSWVHYSYDTAGRVIKEVRPFMDSPETALESSCEVTTFDYTALNNLEEIRTDDTRWRTKVITTCGVETHREYALYFSNHEEHIIAARPGVAYNDPDNRVEKTYFESYYDYNYEQQTRNTRVERADGTSSEYTYTTSSHTVYTVGNSFTIYTTTTTTVNKYLGNIVSRNIVTTNNFNTTEHMREYVTCNGVELLVGGFDTTVDEFGRPLATTTVDGDETRYVYLQLPLAGDSSPNPILHPHTQITAPDGTEIVEYYDAWKRKALEIKNGVKTTFVYDANNNLIRKTITGRNGGTLTSSSVYSEDGQLFSDTDECGNTTIYSYGIAWKGTEDPLGNITKTEYYLDKRVKRILLNDVQLKAYEYGVENGEIYTKESSSVSEWFKTFVNFVGDEYKTVYADGYSRITIFDAYAHVTLMRDSVGNSSRYEYDQNTGELSKQIANGVVSVFRNGWRGKHGTVVAFSETLGYFRGDLVVLSRNETSRDKKSSWTFSNGKKSSSVKKHLTAGVSEEIISNFDGSVVQNTYVNNVLSCSKHLLNGSRKYSYDEFDRVEKVSQFFNGTEIVSFLTYDNCSRLLSTTLVSQESSRTKSYTYDANGRCLSESSPGGTTIDYQYNPQNSITQISGGTYPQNYAYDSQNRLISLTVYQDSETPQTTCFEYDCRGNLSKKIYPDGSYEIYTYRLDGQLLSYRNCRGQIVEYGYDACSRLISMRGDSIYWNFAYDYRGAMISASDGDVVHSFEYNAFGQIESENFSDIPNTQIKYFLDGTMRRVAMTFDGEQTQYFYDGTNRLASITQNDLSFKYARVSGTDILKRKDVIRNGEYIHSSTRTFNPFMELTGIGEYTYTLDLDGKRTVAAFSGNTWQYQYDNKKQITNGVLTAADGETSAQCSYAYDEMGNRLSIQFIRDADGNTLNVNNRNCSYDPLNRLIAVTDGNKTYRYKYDYSSRIYRIETWLGETLVSCRRLVYDKWNVIAEYLDGIKVKTYLWGEDLSGSLEGAGGVAGLLAENNSIGTFLPVYDGNGNIVRYLNSSAEPVANYAYDPFGNLVASNGVLKDEFNYRFSTKRDMGGLYYYGLRLYDSANGVWISRDPIGENGGINLHAFVGNDGINYVDILGMGWFTQCCNGEEISKWYQCCCTNGVPGENKYGGLPINKKEIYTGVEYFVDRSRWYNFSIIPRPFSPSQFLLRHAWLRHGEQAAGAYPADRSFWEMFWGYFGIDPQGQVLAEKEKYTQKEHKFWNLTFSKQIYLSPCENNITQFKSCIDSHLKGAVVVWHGWNNCLDWVHDTVSLCKNRSKGCGE